MSSQGKSSRSTAIAEAVAHHQRGDLRRASQQYRRILRSDPRNFEALRLLGALELQLGKPGDAVQLISRALDLNPQSAQAHFTLGNAFHAQNNFEDAVTCYERAISCKSDFGEAFYNRGNALLDLGRCTSALESYERALAIAPGYPEARHGRGNALHQLKRYAEALTCYEQALDLAPHYADALNSRGIALVDLNRPQEALINFDRAIAIDPEYAEAFNNRANALRALRQYEESIRDFEQALRLRPGYEYALGAAMHLKLHLCDWSTFEQDKTRLAAEVRAGARSAPPFSFIVLSDSAQDSQSCARIYAAHQFPQAPESVWKNERYNHRKIRLAYVSADFRQHAAAQLAAGLFEKHDRERFEITAVSLGAHDGSLMRTRLEKAFDRFIDASTSGDLEVAHLIRGLEIDIAIDMMGYTQHSRTGIFAHRPAPVQVILPFYPGTLATNYIDYIIADRWVLPEQHRAYYSEHVATMPDTFIPTDNARAMPQSVPTRAAVGLPPHGFVYCSFNGTYKITPVVFDVWMNLLRKVDSSVLWLLEDHPLAIRNLRREAAARGVAADRLVFAGRASPEEHLARQALADLFLDSLPVNAGATAHDAVCAGLPVLTCLGTTFVGRVAASMMNALGLPELVTRTLPEYEAMATRLAMEPSLLADIRSSLIRNRETLPLFDTDRYRRHIEAAYTTMWERSERGEAPADFAVAPASP